jgi:hypothetical protein
MAHIHGNVPSMPSHPSQYDHEYNAYFITLQSYIKKR